MEDDLDNFIQEQKVRVAEDKARLEEDLPYMEVKHRVSGSTVKENIPPKCSAVGKEESCSLGLPLGIEYEKKKHRLQQDLRIDYRRYMAQAAVVPKHQHTLQRDASTQTEHRRGMNRVTAKTFGSEKDEDCSSGVFRHSDWQRGAEESEEEKNQLMASRKYRQTGAGTTYEKRRFNKTDGRYQMETREKRENPGSDWEHEKLTVLNSNDCTEFGLFRGRADSQDALKRKKERYRQELQEQIAEQKRNKKKERELQMNVAITGVNDPEKQPDRISRLGLFRQKDDQGLDSSVSAERMTVRGSGLFPNIQPAVRSHPRTRDTPRLPVFPSAAPSEAYRSPYGDSHHRDSSPHDYYGTSNPNMSGRNMLSQFGTHSPQSQRSGSSILEHPIQSSEEVISQVPGFPSDRSRPASEKFNSYREELSQQMQEKQKQRQLEKEEEEHYEAQLNVDCMKYQPWGRGGGGAPLRDSKGNLITDLNQMHKLNMEAYSNPDLWERRARASTMASQSELHNPNPIIADLAQSPRVARGKVFFNQPDQHQFCENKYQTELRQQMEEKKQRKEEERERKKLEDEKEEKRLAEQRARIYREYLEEKEKEQKKWMQQAAIKEALLQAEERNKEEVRQKREAEDKEKAAQRRQFERERQARVDEVRRRNSPVIPALRNKLGRQQNSPPPPTDDSHHYASSLSQSARNKEFPHQAEERYEEVTRKKREAEDEEKAAQRRQFETERQAREKCVHHTGRRNSPVIPPLRNKLGWQQNSPPPSHHSASSLSERSVSALRSPPIAACRNLLQASGYQRSLFSELAALRRQLRSEQKRIEISLQQGDCGETDSPLSDRSQDRPHFDMFDLAKLQRQPPLGRPNSRKTEPQHLQKIHSSLRHKLTDGESNLGLLEVQKQGEVGVASSRKQDYGDLYQLLSSQRSTARDDLDLSPPQPRDYLRSAMEGPVEGSLLESESAFIDPLGNTFPVPCTPEIEKTPKLSARQRRRLARQSEHCLDVAASSQHGCTVDRLQQEAEPRGDEMTCRGNRAGQVHLSDDEGSHPPHFPLHKLQHQSPIETITADVWMRPEHGTDLRGGRLRN